MLSVADLIVTNVFQAGSVAARKSLKIQRLSKILILHLKRFGYGSQGSTKLHKPVYFPLELILGRELLVSPSTEVKCFCSSSFLSLLRYMYRIWYNSTDNLCHSLSESKRLYMPCCSPF